MLRILGNGAPSLSQMKFVQAIISLIAEEDIQKNKQLATLIESFSTQSQECLRKDTLYERNFPSQAIRHR